MNHLSFPKKYRIFGADTETIDGRPYCFQVSDDGKTAELIWVNENNILKLFLDYMFPKLFYASVNVVYFHQLSFDIAVLLYGEHKKWIGNENFKLDKYGWEMSVVVSKVCFAFLKHKKTNKQLKILDSRAFFPNIPKSDLAGLSEQLHLPSKKLDKPDGLGTKRLKTKEFIDYAKNDAVCEYNLASWIIEQHRDYNCRISVSSSQFSARIFRHDYIRKGDRLIYPPDPIVEASLLSYHGGKNGFYCPGVTIAEKCYDIDIVSAYPYAMKQIPNFISGHYEYRGKYDPDYEGVWCICGKLSNCKYPILFSHNFKPLRDKADNVWVTSYELKEALKMKEIILKTCYGYIYIPSYSEYNPLCDFVDHFYGMKEKTPKSDSRYILYKVILNSLYGKFIQTIEYTEPDKDKKGSNVEKEDFIQTAHGEYIENPEKRKKWNAGGLFNPFIATLITGYVRAYLHRLEHKYQSLDSSTDSIKTLQKPDEVEGLGGYKIACVGKCILLRNKLYLHYNEKGELKKYALHGFSGNVQQLKELFDRREKKYKVNHMFKVREAFRQKKRALAVTTVDRKLEVDFSKIYYL